MPVGQDHEEIKELLGAYALNAVPEDETTRVDLHLASCTECREELNQHREVASMLAVSERFAPSVVWDSIAEEIAVEHTATPVSRPAAETFDRFRRWLAPVAIAAAFMLVAGSAVVQSVRLRDARDELANERETVAELNGQLDRPFDVAASQALSDPAAQRVTLGSEVSGANAIIVLMPDGTGYVAEHTLQPLPADRTYQLWAIVGGKVISAGVLGSNPGVVPFHIDPEGFEGFAITEEEVGGVVSSQNDAVVAWLAA